MNILLWVLQSILALLGIAGGAFKIFMFTELQKSIASARELPQGLWVLIGAFEIVAGLGLILPGVDKRWSRFVRPAAIAMAVESVLITALYVNYRDFPPVSFAVIMGLAAAFIAYGRSK